uniref:DDB1- and CUL4-associated factor 15 WD40 repeat-containing domain-containing protein n=1 Tax=Anopheles atroparvus TaxID=41427 RepID=A0A182IQT7_ANOAO
MRRITMDANRSIGEEADRFGLTKRRLVQEHRFFTRSNSDNRTQNITLKVLNREHSGYLATGLNRRSHQEAFQEVPERLQFCLKDIVPYCYLYGHVFMGLTSCGQFLLSYKVSYDHEEAFANGFNFSSTHKYELYFWIYRPHVPLSKYFHVCLFDDHRVDEIRSVSFTQWKTESQLLIVHGSSTNDESDSYVTMVRVPKLGCLDCKQVRDAHNGDEERQDILCIGCNMTIHMKYRSTDSGPRFNPNFNLNCPGYVIMNENSFIHTIRVELDTKRCQQKGPSTTTVLSSKYLGNVASEEEHQVTQRVALGRGMDSTGSLGTKQAADVGVVSARKCLDTEGSSITQQALLNAELSIAEQIIADFAEYETDVYEAKCSMRSYPDNFDELIITSPRTQEASSELAGAAKVRLINHRNNTNIELRLAGAVGPVASSSSAAAGGTAKAGPSLVPAATPVARTKSYVTRVDLQSGNSSSSSQACLEAGSSSSPPNSTPGPLCDMPFTASSSSTSPAPPLVSRVPLRRRFVLSESSYVPNINLGPLQHCVVSGSEGTSFHVGAGSSVEEPEADPAAKAYEFSEDNERCEKISAFRKRRLADKKYEFSEEHTSEENIEPFNRLRNQIRARVATPGYSPSHHHSSYTDHIPAAHHLHRASPNHGFRSPCGSPVGNRYLRSPPGIRSPSYYRHRSPSSQGPNTVGSSVVIIGGGGPGGSGVSAAGKQPHPQQQQQQLLKRPAVPLDPRDYIQKLGGCSGPGFSSGTAAGSSEGSPDIPKFFLDAIQKINEKKQQQLDETVNNENNINCDNQLPARRGNGNTNDTSTKPVSELPTCTKKIVKIYVEEDDANSVVTTEEDDCISPGYHASLPMEVHGSCYSNMQIISQASYNKLHCPAVIVTQNSFDMEMFSFHVANHVCTKEGKKYGILLDSAYELTHVCPLTETITCTMVLQFTVNNMDNSVPKPCKNCSTMTDCQKHRKVYQCRSLFTWCVTTGEWYVLDYGALVSGPYLEMKNLCSNYSRLLKQLRKFTKKLFAKGAADSETNRTYEYLRHLRVHDSDLSKTKQRLTDLENMIEFYRRHPGGSDSGTDSDSYGEEEDEEEDEDDDDDDDDDDEDDEDEDYGDSSTVDESHGVIGDVSVASDTVSDEDDP